MKMSSFAVVISTALVFVIALSSCQATIPPYTINVPPHLADVRPRRSVVFFRSDIPLDRVHRAIEEAVPREVVGNGQIGGLAATWNLKRSAARFHAINDGLAVEISLLGEITVSGGPLHCSTSDGGVLLTAAMQPALHDAGELAFDHVKVEPSVAGSLNCAGFPIPISAVVDHLAAPMWRTLAAGLEKIRLPLAPLLRLALSEISTPRTIDVPPNGTKACLDLDARALVLSPVGGDQQVMSLKVGADVSPRLSLGSCEQHTQTTPRALTRVLVKTVPLADHFELSVAIAVPYRDLNERIAPRVEGQRLGDGSKSVTLSHLSLGDAQGRVLARVEARGALAGTLYLWGTPSVTEHNAKLALHVPDLHAALETRSAAQKLKLWLWKLIDGGLEPLLRKNLVLDITDRVAQVRTGLTGRHALVNGSPALTLTTIFSRVSPGAVSSREGAVIIYPVLAGTAEITLEN